MSLSGPWNQIGKLKLDVEAAGLDLVRLFRASPCQGNRVTFWLDCWVSSIHLFSRFSNMFTIEKYKWVTVEKRCKVVNGMRMFDFCWSR
ncbi:hypothetical protein Hanom_Chr14g01295031 [Helianthus anomalus]